MVCVRCIASVDPRGIQWHCRALWQHRLCSSCHGEAATCKWLTVPGLQITRQLTRTILQTLASGGCLSQTVVIPLALGDLLPPWAIQQCSFDQWTVQPWHNWCRARCLGTVCSPSFYTNYKTAAADANSQVKLANSCICMCNLPVQMLGPPPMFFKLYLIWTPNDKRHWTQLFTGAGILSNSGLNTTLWNEWEQTLSPAPALQDFLKLLHSTPRSLTSTLRSPPMLLSVVLASVSGEPLSMSSSIVNTLAQLSCFCPSNGGNKTASKP